MEAQIRDIVAHFMQKAASEIQAETVIDRSAVAGSILIHRMYASLAEAGFAVEDYQNIRTFGELQSTLNGKASGADPTAQSTDIETNNSTSLGVDVQNISELPAVDDYRSDAFYQATFSPEEISYCVLQPNPRQSFAGLFAAKEALVKAKYSLSQRPLNELVLTHDSNGKPGFEEFEVSISHSGEVAMAAALFQPLPAEAAIEDNGQIAALAASLKQLTQQNQNLKRGLWFSGLLTILALTLTLLQYFELLIG